MRWPDCLLAPGGGQSPAAAVSGVNRPAHRGDPILLTPSFFLSMMRRHDRGRPHERQEIHRDPDRGDQEDGRRRKGHLGPVRRRRQLRLHRPGPPGPRLPAQVGLHRPRADARRRAPGDRQGLRRAGHQGRHRRQEERILRRPQGQGRPRGEAQGLPLRLLQLLRQGGPQEQGPLPHPGHDRGRHHRDPERAQDAAQHPRADRHRSRGGLRLQGHRAPQGALQARGPPGVQGARPARVHLEPHALPRAGPGHPHHRRGHARARRPRPGGHGHRRGGGRRPQAVPGLRRPARGQGDRHRRRQAPLRQHHHRPVRREQGRHDRRAFAAALGDAPEDLEEDHGRASRRHARRLRADGETAGHHRIIDT